MTPINEDARARSTGVPTPRSAAKFAASAAGAKERVVQGGTHTSGVPARSAGGCAAPGPSTQASAPLSGSPRNREILWGETAPGRLGREDARNFGGGTPKKRARRKTRRARAPAQ